MPIDLALQITRTGSRDNILLGADLTRSILVSLLGPGVDGGQPCGGE